MFKTLRERIKKLERKGYTGKTDAELHRLNKQQTNVIPTHKLEELIESRHRKGKPIGKLVAARSRRVNKV